MLDEDEELEEDEEAEDEEEIESISLKEFIDSNLTRSTLLRSDGLQGLDVYQAREQRVNSTFTERQASSPGSTHTLC
ncbi:hypothetical protein [Alkalibacillus haloalkaliphilus]|uniref:hypothetical protein n=1 Tax=Alkalibacillus haloalkaliphilus TaxID=94136 RepID=UPI00031F0765|nr:hypothetical protein [Alkalibacillus haloalkaliphilus]